MKDAPTKRRLVFRPSRLTLVLSAAIVASAVLTAWGLTHGARIAPPEAPQQRMMRQVRDHGGAGVELRYAEPGLRRAVCGYIGRSKGGSAVGFVSTSNRILFSDDPLPVEFAEMRERYCPGFLQGPAQPSPTR